MSFGIHVNVNVQVLDRLLSMFQYDCEKVGSVLDAVAGKHIDRDTIRNRARTLMGYQAQLQVLLKNPGYKQRTPEWYDARKRVVTASELLQATGSKSAQRQFLKRKCFPGQSFSLAGVPAVRHGVIYEDVACRAYEARNHVKVHEFGLLPNRRIECFGASPDGICSNGVMLEIKCVYSREIQDGYVKPEYYQQMQGQMHTAELAECDFLECKITEYDSLDAFLEDTSPDEPSRGTALTKSGMEKGAITYHYDETENKEVYGYSPYELDTGEVALWASQQEQHKTVVYYKFDVYNCQRIPYDPNFMVETEPKIRDSFALFMKYRDKPEMIDIDYPETSKRTRVTGLPSFAFVDYGSSEALPSGTAFVEPVAQPARDNNKAKANGFSRSKLRSFAFV